MKDKTLTIRWWQFVLPAMIFLTLFSCKEDSVDPLEGSFIVFNSHDADGHYDLVKMDYQSGSFIFLTNTAEDEVHPDISPDRKKIVYARNLGGDFEIWVMNSDGSGSVQLTSNDDDDVDPKWDHSGARIVFTSYSTGNGDIYIMDADGSNREQLTTSLEREEVPDLSPDGSIVVFHSGLPDHHNITYSEIGLANRIDLTSDGDNVDPNISPDGTMIAFVKLIEGDDEIFYMNMDGSGMNQVTFNDVNDYRPYWAPDNDHIVYTSQAGVIPEWDLHIIQKDGLGDETITQFAGPEYSSSWR